MKGVRNKMTGKKHYTPSQVLYKALDYLDRKGLAEDFYINEILPKDSRSLVEIISEIAHKDGVTFPPEEWM